MSIELPVTSRHLRDMTERLLKATLSPKQTNEELLFSFAVNISDVDECSAEKGNCDHYCQNSIGSFECSCRTGYMLRSDGKMCAGIHIYRNKNSMTHG